MPLPQSTYVCLGEITIYNHFNVYSFTKISILTINNSSCVKGRPNMPLMTRHLANPSDLSKMMRIRACLRQCSTPERVSSSTSDKSFCSLLATSRCRNCLHARPYSLGIGWNSNSRSSCWWYGSENLNNNALIYSLSLWNRKGLGFNFQTFAHQ